jgi:hypothetical protein
VITRSHLNGIVARPSRQGAPRPAQPSRQGAPNLRRDAGCAAPLVDALRSVAWTQNLDCTHRAYLSALTSLVI